jgi:DNA adenine methylase
MNMPAPMLRYHGGKYRQAPWILSFFPPHRVYVEPFGGAASVLLQKPRSPVEVLNDLDGDVVNFYRVMRDATSRAALIEQLGFTPCAREEFELAFEGSPDPIERARRLAVRSIMGYGSAAATKSTTGMRIYDGRDQRRVPDAQHWARYPDCLAAIGARLEGVLVECRPGLGVMHQHDSPETLHYVDPPYLHSTRVRASGAALRYYRHEMTEWDHVQLLAAVKNLKGSVIVSGYPSELYDAELFGWRRETRQARISGHRGTALRTEVLWVRLARD